MSGPVEIPESRCREVQRTHVHTCSEVRCLSNVTSPQIEHGGLLHVLEHVVGPSRPVPLLRALNPLLERMQEAGIDLGRINGNRIKNRNRDWTEIEEVE